MKSQFIIFDGIDGSGKDTLINFLIKNFKKQKIFNLNEYWNKHNEHPKSKIWENYDIIISSEPTYTTIGKYIRNTLIKKGNHYSTQSIAQAYALDRNLLYEKVIIPALNAQKIIIQSRGISSTIAYQQLTGHNDEFTLDNILNLPGNKLALKYAPNLLIIPYIDNIQDKVMQRLKNRKKQDNAIFEKTNFLKNVQQIFLSKEYQSIFTKNNSKVIYINNSFSLQEAENQIHSLYQKYLCN